MLDEYLGQPHRDEPWMATREEQKRITNLLYLGEAMCRDRMETIKMYSDLKLYRESVQPHRVVVEVIRWGSPLF